MEGTDAVEDKTRLRVKLGAAEIEYEGGAASLEKLIMPTVAKMIEMVESHAELQRPSAAMQIEQSKTATPQLSSSTYDHSTNTIAVSMNASSASELAIAACAHLAFVKKKERFSRKEMLDEMKSAPSFFNSNMPGNHSKTLAILTDGGRLRLVDAPNKLYALSNEERIRLEQVLAQIN